MKLLNIKLPFTVNDLLNYFDLLGTRDLQRVAEKISHLLANRNSPNPEEQETKLLAIINQKLPLIFLKRFEFLKSKMQSGKLAKTEILEMEAYVEEIEEFDTKKINALNKLAQLRKTSFQQLATDLNAFPRNYE